MGSATTYHIDNNFIKSPIDFGEISLVQIGRRFCAPGESTGTHTHLGWFELTVALGGDATVRTNDTVVNLPTGEIHLSLPYEIHEIRADATAGFEYDFFAFVTNDKNLEKRLEEIMHRIAASKKRTFRDGRLEFLIKCAINEYSEGSPKDTATLRHIFALITEYLVRDFEEIDEERISTAKAKVMCYKIMNYIDTHIYSMGGTAELAEVFGYSYNYLSTLFKRTAGKTVSEYYTARRLEHAKILIMQGEKKVWEIAELLHYSSPFAFTKAFTAKYGVSPRKMQASSKIK